jgi:hypothetical protein
MNLRFILRVMIFFSGVWAAIVVALSLLGEPFLFLPSDNNTALFPPLYRYETLRLTFFSMFAYLSLQTVFAPEKKYSATQITLTTLLFLGYIGAIKFIPEGNLGKETGVLLTIIIFAAVFYFASRPKIKKIFGRH